MAHGLVKIVTFVDLVRITWILRRRRVVLVLSHVMCSQRWGKVRLPEPRTLTLMAGGLDNVSVSLKIGAVLARLQASPTGLRG